MLLIHHFEYYQVRQIAVEAERSEMEKKIEAKYAQKLSEEYQREMVRRQVQNNGGFINGLWAVLKTTAEIVTSPIWIPVKGAVKLLDDIFLTSK